MRQLLAIAIVVAMPSCKSKEDKQLEQVEKMAEKLDQAVERNKNRKPTGLPRPQSKLTVTFDGKPQPMATALAWKRYDGSFELTVSSVPVACGEVTGEMRSLYDGEVTFDVIAGANLAPDGTMKPVIRQWSYDGSTTANPQPATGTGDGTPAQPTTLDVEFTQKGVDMHGPGHTITVKGTIDALGCPPPAPKEAAPALPPEQPATIEIAGKKLAVRSAVYSMVGDWPSLELRTGGESCANKAYEVPSEFRISLTWFKKDDPAVSQVSLGGGLLPNQSDQTFDKKKLTVKPVPSGAGPVELHGDIKVMDYPVKLDGKVTAVVCPK
jgi:hypothetical protein